MLSKSCLSLFVRVQLADIADSYRLILGYVMCCHQNAVVTNKNLVAIVQTVVQHMRVGCVQAQVDCLAISKHSPQTLNLCHVLLNNAFCFLNVKKTIAAGQSSYLRGSVRLRSHFANHLGKQSLQLLALVKR